MNFSNDRPDSHSPSAAPRRGSTVAKAFWAVAAAALLGSIFSAISTADFIEHLDRQVHSIHCSFIPGAAQDLGESGCRTVMLSPYSSWFRESMWGGMPISLFALAVFAYLVYRAGALALKNYVTRRDAAFLMLATALPVVMSLIYGFIALTKIGAVCKLCIGVYVTSLAAFGAATWAWRQFPSGGRDDGTPSQFVRYFIEGVVFVVVLVGAYLMFVPKSDKAQQGCGALVKQDDPNGILVPYHSAGENGKASIAVLDPLCSACRAFDARLSASGLLDRLNIKVALFPLDHSCNWMVKESLHPGACAVSEAILCDREHASDIISWAFEKQEQLLEEAKTSEEGVRRRLVEAFPSVRGCLGSPTVRNKLNKSLRWAVANALPVLTPQLFVGGKRLCDEDTDLGLEFSLARMLSDNGAGAARK